MPPPEARILRDSACASSVYGVGVASRRSRTPPFDSSADIACQLGAIVLEVDPVIGTALRDVPDPTVSPL